MNMLGKQLSIPLAQLTVCFFLMANGKWPKYIQSVDQQLTNACPPATDF